MEYQEADAITKDKVDTVENLVKSMVEERSGYRKLRQDNITLSMDLKASQEVVKSLEEKLNTLCLNSVHYDDRVSTESKGATMIIEPEAPTDSKEMMADSCLNDFEDRLSEESIPGLGKVRDCSSEEKIEVSDSDSDSDSIDYDTDSDLEVDQSDEDFIVEDGITYMFVARCSMTRQYILLDENEDENWFPKTKVYEELEAFLNCKHHIIGKGNSTQQRSDLKIILDGIRKGMKDQVINDEFLNLAFMMFYETIDCQE